jgi:hypothetical protein
MWSAAMEKRAVFRLAAGGSAALLLASAALGLAAPRPRDPTEALKGVPGLSARVTYSETQIPLGELLQRVSADTHVPLSATRDTADEPVAAIVTGVEARGLLATLAELLDYQWSSREKDGGNLLELGQDLAARAREEELRRDVQAEVESTVAEAVKRAVDMAALPQDEIDRLIAEGERRQQEIEALPEPLRSAVRTLPGERARTERYSTAAALWSPINRTLGKLLGDLRAEDWNTLRSGELVTFSSSPVTGQERLPPGIVQALRAARFQRSRPGPASPPDFAAELAELEVRSRELWDGASGFQVVVALDSDSGGDRWRLALNAYPLQNRSPARGFTSGANGYLHLTSGSNRYYQRLQGAELTPERAAFLDADPVLGRRSPFLPGPKDGVGEYYPQILDYYPAVCRAYGLGIVSDAYSGSVYPGQVAFPAPVPAWTVMDRLTRVHHVWEWRRGLVRVRHRTWFLARRMQVPIRVLRGWIRRVEEAGALSWREVVESRGLLRPKGLRFGVGEIASELQGIPFDLGVPGPGVAPELVAELNPGQRQLLLRGQPVPFSSLNARQRALFMKPLRRAAVYHVRYRLLPTEPLDPDRAGLSLRVDQVLRTREKQGGKYSFEVAPAPAGWTAPPPGGSTNTHLLSRLNFRFDSGAGVSPSEQITIAGPLAF